MSISRILIVGLGSIGKRHLRLLRSLMPNADIKVLRHKITDGISQDSNDYFFCIEDAIIFAPQVAVIASPAPFHMKVAQKLAEVGVHLLIEKPLSTSLDGISELIEVCKQKNLVLSTGYNLRFLQSLQYYKKVLDEGVIGKVLSVRCEVGQYLPSWRLKTDYRESVSAKRDLGGGVLLELSHELDYLRWIFGEVGWVKATLSKQSDLEIDVEDTAHLILGLMQKSSKKNLICSVNLDFIRHDTTRLCTAIGERGSLRWNGLTSQITLYESGGKEWRELLHSPHLPDDSYLAELSCFIDCVTNNKIPPISGEDGLKVMKIIDAAYKSVLAYGKLVEI